MSVGVCLLPLHGKDSSTGAKTAGRPSHAGPASLHRGQSQRDRSRAATAACVCGCRGGRKGGTSHLLMCLGLGLGLGLMLRSLGGLELRRHPGEHLSNAHTDARRHRQSAVRLRALEVAPRRHEAHTQAARGTTPQISLGAFLGGTFPAQYRDGRWRTTARGEVARVQLRPPLAKGIECRNSRALLNLI
jgi:hypothetical protein